MELPYDPNEPEAKEAELQLNRSWPTMICTCCQGDGTVLLEDHLWVTLKGIILAGEVCAKQLHAMHLKRTKLTRITPEAFNNHLVALERMGFAKRIRKEGKTWFWGPGKRFLDDPTISHFKYQTK